MYSLLLILCVCVCVCVMGGVMLGSRLWTSWLGVDYHLLPHCTLTLCYTHQSNKHACFESLWLCVCVCVCVCENVCVFYMPVCCWDQYLNFFIGMWQTLWAGKYFSKFSASLVVCARGVISFGISMQIESHSVNKCVCSLFSFSPSVI